MAVGTFAQLVASIKDWAERPELSDTLVSDFITLTESVFNYGEADLSPLRVREMETVATVTAVDGVGAFPADFLEIIKIKDPSDVTRSMDYVSPEWIDENFPDGQDATYPEFYTVIGDSLYSPITVSMMYYAKIPTLVSGADSQTNWLVAKAPNAYLYGGLFQYAIFNKNAEAAGAYRGLFSSAVQGLQRGDINARAGTFTKRAWGASW